MQARFSLPYALAALVTDGVLDAGTFLPDGLGRPAVADLARRVDLVEDPVMSAALPRERPATVTVQLRDGRRGTGRVRTARGNPDHPLSPTQVAVKFRGNAGDLVPSDLVDDLLAGVLLAPSADGPSSARTVARLARAVLDDL
jgi:2-methylcitrate dehydratase PrpD